jgi:NADH-quinone oxidoreductase subunit N
VAFAEFESTHVLFVLPEILLLSLAGLILAVDIFWRRQRRLLGWVSAGGLLLTFIATVVFSRPEIGGEPLLIFGGMLRHDWIGFTFTLVFIFAAAVTSIISLDLDELAVQGEYFALLLVAAFGMCLMATAADLMMLLLAIETTSIPLYILAGFIKADDKSTEAGIKYFLFGALTSAVMLYGFSLLYGFTGETNIYRLAAMIRVEAFSPWVLLGAMLLVLVGFGFKVSVVPFHFWSPDVYEGAPTPITAFISTASKAAGFAVLLRVMLVAFPTVESYWTTLLAILAAATMTLGNLLAISQKNIKRLLAYSSIAHAGYALIGLVALSSFGAASLVFYLVGYVVTNLAAFTIVILFAQTAGSEQIADYAGLSRRSPGLALALMLALLSLAGMPPLVGFVAKFYVFAAAVQSGWIWLAIVAVLNAIIGLYYYMTILKVVYLYRSDEEHVAIDVPRPLAVTLGLCSLAIVGIGTISGPWLNLALEAAKALF